MQNAFSIQITLDQNFNIGSGFNNTVWILKYDTLGRIYAGGSFTNYNTSTLNRIVRLNFDGSVDTTFNSGTGFNNTVRCIALQTDGKIIVGGNFTTYNGTPSPRIIRLHPNGQIDTSFNVGTGFNSEVYAIELLNDGRIIVGGQFATYNTINSSKIALLHPNGSIDSSFIIGSGFAGSFTRVSAIQIQPDGKFIIGGNFNNYQGSPIPSHLIRLNPNASIDTSFFLASGANGTIHSLFLMNDGRIMVGGLFLTLNGNASSRLIRLNNDGSLDNTFSTQSGFINPPGTSSSQINSIFPTPDGKFLIGGTFAGYDFVNQGKLIKINLDGTLDTSFNIQTGFGGGLDFVSSIAYNGINSFAVGGSFVSINGITQSRIAQFISLNSMPISNYSSFPTNISCFDVDSVSTLNIGLNQIFAIRMSPTGHVGFAVGSGGTVQKTTDGGSTWNNSNSGIPANLFLEDAFVFDNNNAVIAGTNFISSEIYRTSNGGQTWNSSQISGNDSINIRDLSFVNASLGYAIGESFSNQSRLYKTINGGVSWSVLQTFGNQFVSVDFTDSLVGYIGGFNGSLAKTTNGGQNWNTIPGIINGDIVTMNFTSQDSGYIAVNDFADSYILKTNDGAVTLDTLHQNSNTKVFEIMAFTNGWLAVGDNKVTFFNDNNNLINSLIVPSSSFRSIGYLNPDSLILGSSQNIFMMYEPTVPLPTITSFPTCLFQPATIIAQNYNGVLKWYSDSLLQNLINVGSDSIIINVDSVNFKVYLQVVNGTCLSQIIVHNLTVEVLPIDSISFDGMNLVVNNLYDTYKWIDCTTGSLLANGNQAFFLPPQAGIYSVVVSLNNCSDTLPCFNYNTTGLRNQIIAPDITIYPNPTTGEFTVKSSFKIKRILIFNSLGQTVKTYSLNEINYNLKIDISELPENIYTVLVEGEESLYVQRIVKISN